MIPKIDNLNPYNATNFFLLAGPCIVEDEKNVMHIAEKLVRITEDLKIPYVFKASYRKANRTSSSSFTGIGDEKALKILDSVRKKFNIPVVTDIHESQEAAVAAEYVDILQIPAFLCRQTELLIAAAKTNKWINIKKGQFLNGEAMRFATQKVLETGNDKVILTDRGNSFGYSDIIVDYRNIKVMQKFDVPVVMDCTHSLQQPNQKSGVTGGNPEFIETIAACAIAAGADGLFIETHPDPKNAKSDGANMLHLDLIKSVLEKCVRIKQAL